MNKKYFLFACITLYQTICLQQAIGMDNTPPPTPPTIKGQVIDGFYKGIFHGVGQETAKSIQEGSELVKFGVLKGSSFIYSLFRQPSKEENVEELNNTILGVQLYENWNQILNKKLQITNNLILKYTRKLETCDNIPECKRIMSDIDTNLRLRKLIKKKMKQIDQEFTQTSIQELNDTNYLRNIITAILFPFQNLPKTFSLLYTNIKKSKKSQSIQKKSEIDFFSHIPTHDDNLEELDQEETKEPLEELKDIGDKELSQSLEEPEDIELSFDPQNQQAAEKFFETHQEKNDDQVQIESCDDNITEKINNDTFENQPSSRVTQDVNPIDETLISNDDDKTESEKTINENCCLTEEKNETTAQTIEPEQEKNNTEQTPNNIDSSSDEQKDDSKNSIEDFAEEMSKNNEAARN